MLTQVELLCAVSDLSKLDTLEIPVLRQLGNYAVAAAAVVLSCSVSADMFFTAKLFHHPQVRCVCVSVGGST